MDQSTLERFIHYEGPQKIEPEMTKGPMSGCIPIAHHGCEYWSVLITAGSLASTVWDLASFVVLEDEWFPAHRPPGVVSIKFAALQLPRLGQPASFTEWIDSWLERCETDLRAVDAAHPPSRVMKFFEKIARRKTNRE